MLPRSRSVRALVLATMLALATAGVTAPVEARPAPTAAEHVAKAKAKATDPRRTRRLFVDPLMPAVQQGGVYRTEIGRKSQAFWVGPEYYPTSEVRRVVRRYTARALTAKKIPVVTVYGIPDRDCGLYSSGGLPGATAYKNWVRQIARGLRGQQALVVLEPDAIPFYGDARCQNAGNRLGLLRYAAKVLSSVGAWVYLDAGHSGWTPYANRAALLKRAGIGYARGFSTNVSNFRTTAAEKRYAAVLLRDLRRLKVRGKRYVIDSSRNGVRPVDGQVINPTWARLGRAPRLVFQGAFDGTLWVKHPGESDGTENGGPGPGQWCDLLADRLLNDRTPSRTC